MRAFTSEDWRAVGFATLAGLSTAIGGLIAVLRQPDSATLAFLLGTAIGVMATLSIIEMWLNNALEHGFFEVTACAGLGALLYVVLGPLIPEVELPLPKKNGQSDSDAKNIPMGPITRSKAAGSGQAGKGGKSDGDQAAESAHTEAEVHRKRGLMRLGLLMAVTMTLHNLPEGFAVAFASFTDFGPTMAFAVAMHNIPEGIIVAAPIYASTGSRKMAVGMSLASGLSEPAGALIALLAVGPYLTPEGLQLLLATVGGIMTAVCVVELLPEGRKCKEDGKLVWGTAFGAVLMGATLAVGV